MKPYYFDRWRGGRLMAQGVAVHATSFEEAAAKAYGMLNGERAALLFRDNGPCVPAAKCPICASDTATPAGKGEP